MWQSYPTVPISGNYPPFNLDLSILSTLWSAASYLSNQQAVVGGVSNDPTTVPSYSNTNEIVRYYTGDDYPISEPLTEMYYPIFDDAADQVLSHIEIDGDTKVDSASMVAVVGSSFYWRDLIENILPEGTGGIIAVFQNSCNQTFTYSVNGPMVDFQGFYDAHDPKYDELVLESSLVALTTRSNEAYTGLHLTDAICPYSVRATVPVKDIRGRIHHF